VCVAVRAPVHCKTSNTVSCVGVASAMCILLKTEKGWIAKCHKRTALTMMYTLLEYVTALLEYLDLLQGDMPKF